MIEFVIAFSEPVQLGAGLVEEVDGPGEMGASLPSLDLPPGGQIDNLALGKNWPIILQIITVSSFIFSS